MATEQNRLLYRASLLMILQKKNNNESLFPWISAPASSSFFRIFSYRRKILQHPPEVEVFQRGPGASLESIDAVGGNWPMREFAGHDLHPPLPSFLPPPRSARSTTAGALPWRRSRGRGEARKAFLLLSLPLLSSARRESRVGPGYNLRWRKHHIGLHEDSEILHFRGGPRWNTKLGGKREISRPKCRGVL